ncbi:Type III pantothenate kinase [Candidatus Thermoflexus japonica]|uniref:Type III pantothenate kinase n=1 Tax=Candidatus Thermoflexus japonica TaxID=2035417 RepID=A0A2H5Y873_9CHLR|nr:Type III pantothenate kinase [Candidatus Thermoflexus japonica]
MLLCLDIGNTNIKAGVFEGESLIAHWRFSTQRHRLADEYAALFMNLFALHGIQPREIRGCAIACVVPPLRAVFEEMIRHYLGVEPLMVGPGIKTGIRLMVENPREVGADRVANAVATFRLYGGPAIAIAFGTATVFDVISREGEYLGGAIAPGILVAAEALVTSAAQLYQVELIRPPGVIGRNTIQAMQSGLILGFASMVEGMIQRIQAELEEPARVIATGGLADIIAHEVRAIQVVDPHLTLHGLRFLFELNRRGK